MTVYDKDYPGIHYVYLIYHIYTEMRYIGVRSTHDPFLEQPQLDLESYQSSSRNLEFKDDQIQNPQNYRYIILKRFSTRIEANAFETYMLVGTRAHKDPKYHNNSRPWRQKNPAYILPKSSTKSEKKEESKRFIRKEIAVIQIKTRYQVFITYKEQTRYIGIYSNIEEASKMAQSVKKKDLIDFPLCYPINPLTFDSRILGNFEKLITKDKR